MPANEHAPSQSGDTYTQSDPRLKPIPLDQYPWTPLPLPPSPDAIVKVSIIPLPAIDAPSDVFTTLRPPGEVEKMPCWSFLIEKGEEAMLWDLGLREVRPPSPPNHMDSSLKHVVGPENAPM